MFPNSLFSDFTLFSEMAGQDDVIGNLWYGNFKQMKGVTLFFIRRADCKESVSFAKKKNRKHVQEASPISLIFLPEKEMA